MNDSWSAPDPEPSGPPKLPELQSATLDEGQLTALFHDLEACAEITEINAKFAAQGYVPEQGRLTLAEARELLAQRAARGVQIRYRYQDADWLDTLLVQGNAYRLVRIRPDFGNSAPAS
jgi:hypothetical protein